MADLIVSFDDLLAHSQRPDIDEITATTAIRMASAWLADATRLTPWPPVPVPDVLWSWCLELATLIVANPESKTLRGVGGVNDGWVTVRREQILSLARERFAVTASPIGSFDPPPYPTFPEPAPRGYLRPPWAPW